MIIHPYNYSIQSYSVYLPFAFFTFSLFYILLTKTAQGDKSYSQINHIHLKIFFIYFLTLLCLAFLNNDFAARNILGFLVGSFIYFSLHYVYLFALVGLAKKSISINILVSIKKMEILNTRTSEEALSIYMGKQNIGFGDIRENRLSQMTNLGFATIEEDKYQITLLGKIVDQIGSFIFKIWKLKRI